MTDEELRDELARRLNSLEVPPASEDAAVGAALRGVATRRRANKRARTRRAAIVAVAVALVGSGIAWATTVAPWVGGDRVSFSAARASAAKIVADPVLSKLVWLTGNPSTGRLPRIQDLPPAPSLRFPPGVTYPQAARSLFASLAAEGRLPPEASLGPPLPAGRTLEGNPSTGVAIDLRAPRGYRIPNGTLPTHFRAPSLWDPAEVARRQAEAAELGLMVPLGARFPPLALRPCQILDPARPSPPCTLSPPLDGDRVP